MDQIGLRKDLLGKQIVDISLSEYGKEHFQEAQLKEIADFTVNGMKTVRTKQDLLAFLSSLASKWPIFKNLHVIENGLHKNAVDGEIYDGVLTLAKNGKIDDAVKLAKSATSS